MVIFPRGLSAGDPLSKRGLVAGLLRMARAWETLTVQGGAVEWLAGRPKIIIDGVGESGAALPPGGEQYQVLQRDSGGNAVWDWVRAAPDA